jgi:hypothetical protein
MTTEPTSNVVAGMKTLQSELGDNDLAKQVYADASASDRQTNRNHFEARIEYVRQMAERGQATESSVKEYGLQILKWLFLLNAGAIALVLAYVGGKSADAKMAIGPISIASAPFMLGCISVVLAGAFGFFNMSYGFGSLPSAENLHHFLNPSDGKWPRARMQNQDEDAMVFHRRYVKQLNITRYIAIAFACLAAVLFCLGACLVLRVVVR